jgi:hypothetical protein
VQLCEISLPFANWVLKYLRLFKPAQRAASPARVVKLLAEMLPDIKRGAITRNGRDWQVDQEAWREAIETVLARRDQGKLKLPFANHGYLYEVLMGMADAHERQAENDREKERQQRRAVGTQTGTNVITVADALAAAQAPPAAPPTPYQGPSLHAQRLRAEIAAKKGNKA